MPSTPIAFDQRLAGHLARSCVGHILLPLRGPAFQRGSMEKLQFLIQESRAARWTNPALAIAAVWLLPSIVLGHLNRNATARLVKIWNGEESSLTLESSPARPSDRFQATRVSRNTPPKSRPRSSTTERYLAEKATRRFWAGMLMLGLPRGRFRLRQKGQSILAKLDNVAFAPLGHVNDA